MHINNIFGNYDSHLQDSVKLDNNKNIDTSNQTKNTGDMASLKEGSVFKGEILDVAGDKVIIKLENEAQLPARLQGDIQLGVGDQLLFSVKENNINQVLIKPLFDSLYSAQTKVLEQALDLIGLSPTEKNFSAAKALMDAGMPLDKGNMTKLLSQSMKYPDTSMDTLVSLNKLNMPVTEQNIAQYERYQNLQHQITADIDTTVNSMTDFSGLFPNDTEGNTIFSFVRDMTNMFVSQMPESIEQGDVPQLSADTNMTNSPHNTFEAFHTKTSDDDYVQSPSFRQNIEQSNEVNFSETILNLTKQTGLTDKEVTSLLQNVKELGVPEDMITNIAKNSTSAEHFLQNMMSAIEQNMTNDALIKQLLDSPSFKKLFSEMIHKSWSLNPNQMKDPKEIDELYERIEKQSKAFENAILSKGGDGKSFQEGSQNMRQNMSFMEQLNHQMIYAQMPLKLSNQNTNSELFIYADKKKLMEKKDGISVMLHLDMDHLGQTDVKVTLTKTNVHARFYLDDEISVEILENHMDELAKQLGLRGFSLTNEVVKRTPAQSINQVVDEIIDENAEKSIKRYTFDART
ncbi:MAG: flagellar hook-length control protein FliK [Lachnospiraceae bacterium]